jgi:hypothetical protein
VAEQVVTPAKKLPREAEKIRNGGLPLEVIHGIQESLLREGKRPLVHNNLAIHQSNRRDHQTLWLEVAQPSLVGGNRGFAGIGDHFWEIMKEEL